MIGACGRSVAPHRWRIRPARQHHGVGERRDADLPERSAASSNRDQRVDQLGPICAAASLAEQRANVYSTGAAGADGGLAAGARARSPASAPRLPRSCRWSRASAGSRQPAQYQTTRARRPIANISRHPHAATRCDDPVGKCDDDEDHERHPAAARPPAAQLSHGQIAARSPPSRAPSRSAAISSPCWVRHAAAKGRRPRPSVNVALKRRPCYRRNLR